MNRILIASTLLAGCILGGAANAMPMPETSMPATAQKSILVDYACGPGWHLSQWGHCRPNYWRRRPPSYVYHRGYYGWNGPPGWRDRGPPPGWRHDHREDGD